MLDKHSVGTEIIHNVLKPLTITTDEARNFLHNSTAAEWVG